MKAVSASPSASCGPPVRCRRSFCERDRYCSWTAFTASVNAMSAKRWLIVPSLQKWPAARAAGGAFRLCGDFLGAGEQRHFREIDIDQRRLAEEVGEHVERAQG